MTEHSTRGHALLSASSAHRWLACPPSAVAAEAYANVLTVKEGNENDEAVQALVKALQSDEVRTYMEETYAGAVVPLF